MAVPDKIMEEARSIIRMVSKARQAEEDVAAHRPDKPPVSIGDIAGELLAMGSIAPSMRPVEAFEAGLKFWAERVAAELTFDQWQEMSDGLGDEFASDPQVDVVSFMEHLFDGREMKDGIPVWA